MSQSSSKYPDLAIDSQNSLHQNIPQISNFRNPFKSPQIFSFSVSNRPSENPIISPETKIPGLFDQPSLDSYRNLENSDTQGIKPSSTTHKKILGEKNGNTHEIENQMKNFIKNFNTSDKENIPISPNTFQISPSAKRHLTQEFEKQPHETRIFGEKVNAKVNHVNNFPLLPPTETTSDNNQLVSAEFGQLREPFGSDKSKKTPNNRYNNDVSTLSEYNADVQPFTPMNSEQTKISEREPRETIQSERNISRNSSRKRLKPIVVLNIDIGKGNKAEIQVYENDAPEEVAQKFCENHNLPAKVAKILAKNIQVQVDNFYKMKAQKSKRQSNASQSFMDELSNTSMRDNSQADIEPEKKEECQRESEEHQVLEPKYSKENTFQNHLSNLNPNDLLPSNRESTRKIPPKIVEEKDSDTEDRITPSVQHKHYQSKYEVPAQQSSESMGKCSTAEISEVSSSIPKQASTPHSKLREQAAAEHYEKWCNYLSDKKNTSNRKLVISRSPGTYLKQSSEKEIIISPTGKQFLKRSLSTKSARTLNYSERCDDFQGDVKSQFQTAKRAIFDRLYEDGVHAKKMKETMDYIKQRKRESEELAGATFCPKISPISIDIARAKTLRIQTDTSMTSETEKKKRVMTPGARSKANGMSFTSESENGEFRPENYSFIDNSAHSRLYQDAKIKNEKMKTVQEDKTRFGTFKPTLCKESIKMTSRGREIQEEPIFIRLYKTGVEKKRSMSQKKDREEEFLEYDEKTGQKLFQPLINKNSKYYKSNSKKTFDVNGSEPLNNQQRPKTPGAKKSTIAPKTPNPKVEPKSKSTLRGVISPNTVKNAIESVSNNNKSSRTNLSYTATVNVGPKQSISNDKSSSFRTNIVEDKMNMINFPNSKRMSEESTTAFRRDPYPSKKSSTALDVGTQLLSQIFLVLDSDSDGYISAEYVDVSRISPDLIDCISDILFDLENDLTLNFQDFVALAAQYRVVDKLIKLYGIPAKEIDSPDRDFLSTEEGDEYPTERKPSEQAYEEFYDRNEDLYNQPSTPSAKNTKQILLTKKYKEILEKSMKNQ